MIKAHKCNYCGKERMVDYGNETIFHFISVCPHCDKKEELMGSWKKIRHPEMFAVSE
jgi:hypothetical protein